MAEPSEPIASAWIGCPHAFLTGPQSEGGGLQAFAGDSEPVLLRQVHSARVVRADDAVAANARPEADALVTDRSGLTLAIVTADCAPVLLADEQAGVVGAAHAGWRGALDGVIEATVEEMRRLGADPGNMAAAIGPTIAQANYEVDAAFRQRFERADPDNARFFEGGREGHALFDLEGYVAWRLSQGGVAKVDCLGMDTYAGEGTFFSYRRATHCGEATGGRQFSAIRLRETA